MSYEETLDTARSLVQAAVQLANKAGIAPSQVVAPYCVETEATTPDGSGRDSASLTWCCARVVVDDQTTDLFAMSTPNCDPEQEPTFLVTRSTATLVQQDFERYKPSLESMVEDWREAKKNFYVEEEKPNEIKDEQTPG